MGGGLGPSLPPFLIPPVPKYYILKQALSQSIIRCWNHWHGHFRYFCSRGGNIGGRDPNNTTLQHCQECQPRTDRHKISTRIFQADSVGYYQGGVRQKNIEGASTNWLWTLGGAFSLTKKSPNIAPPSRYPLVIIKITNTYCIICGMKLTCSLWKCIALEISQKQKCSNVVAGVSREPIFWVDRKWRAQSFATSETWLWLGNAQQQILASYQVCYTSILFDSKLQLAL